MPTITRISQAVIDEVRDSLEARRDLCKVLSTGIELGISERTLLRRLDTNHSSLCHVDAIAVFKKYTEIRPITEKVAMCEETHALQNHG